MYEDESKVMHYSMSFHDSTYASSDRQVILVRAVAFLGPAWPYRSWKQWFGTRRLSYRPVVLNHCSEGHMRPSAVFQ